MNTTKKVEILEQANRFVREHQAEIDRTYRQHYHLMPPIGWMNDPNGFVFFEGYYHCFYQFHPFEANNGVMFWGHARSKDLIKWEDLPIALAPDQPYDKDGCWSGGAIVKDGKLFLMYTGNSCVDQIITQTQNLAVSSDGIHFEKYENNPVICDTHMPQQASRSDFRDPYLWEMEGVYYALLGNKYEGHPQMLLYRSNDLYNWEFVGYTAKDDEFGIMCECPNFVRMSDSEDIILFSPQEKPAVGYSFYNTSSTAYLVGKLDIISGVFRYNGMREIDFGTDFYATQLTESKHQKIMISWMNMWGRKYATAQMGHKWIGSMCLPRELSLENGMLVQTPIGTIRSYYTSPTSFCETINGEKNIKNIHGRCIHLSISVEMNGAERFELRMLKEGDHYISLSYSKADALVTLDRSRSRFNLGGLHFEKSRNGIRQAVYTGEPDRFEAEIFLDEISMEAFLDGGRVTMTSLCYTAPTGTEISFCSDGDCVVSGEKHDIVIE